MPQEAPFCSQNSVFPCPPKGRQDMQGMSYQIVTKDQGRNSKDFLDPHDDNVDDVLLLVASATFLLMERGSDGCGLYGIVHGLFQPTR